MVTETFVKVNHLDGSYSETFAFLSPLSFILSLPPCSPTSFPFHLYNNLEQEGGTVRLHLRDKETEGEQGK